MQATLVRVLVVATSVLLVAAALTSYAWRAVFDSDRFVDRATAALQDPSVRQVIADRVTDELVLRERPDLLTVRPIIASAVSGIVGGDAFAGLFRRGVRDAHRALFRSDEDTVTLTLVDVGIVAAAAARQLAPDLSGQLEATGRVAVLSRDVEGAAGDVARRAQDLRVLALVLAGLALAAAAGALVLAADRRRTASRLGLAIAVAGVAIVVADLVARAAVLDRVSEPDERAAAGAVWDAFLGDLRTAGWLLAGAGAVVTAAAASLIRPVEVEEPLRAAWRVVTTEPAAPAPRIARGAALVVAGVLVIVQPGTAARVAVTLAGVYVLYKGLEAVMRVVSKPPAAQPDADADAGKGERRSHAPRIAVSVLAALLIGTALTAFAAGGGVDAPAPAITRCNGHAELCDRPFDEVALPATHNSMSVPLPGWFASLQERPIAGQLEDGIRGLLFDTHYGDRLANGRVRTDFADADALRDAIEQDGVSRRASRRRCACAAGSGSAARASAGSTCATRSARSAPRRCRRARRDPRLPRHPSRRGARDRQPGSGHAGGLRRGDGRGRPGRLRLHAARGVVVADAAGDDRADRRLSCSRRNEAGGGAVVPARLRAPHAGDAVHVRRVAELTAPDRLRELRAEPGARRRAALPPQPLGQHGPGAAAGQRHRGQRVRRAAPPRPRLRAPPRAAGQPRGCRLLQAR